MYFDNLSWFSEDLAYCSTDGTQNSLVPFEEYVSASAWPELSISDVMALWGVTMLFFAACWAGRMLRLALSNRGVF